MELFTRDAVLRGPLGEVRTWAIDVAAAYTAATDKEVGVWTAMAGGAVGHFTWSAFFDGAAEMTALAMQAGDDEAYRDAVGAGREYVTAPGVDTLRTPVTPFPDDEGGPGDVAEVISFTARSGHIGQAVAWGLEAVEFANGVTGHQTVLLMTRAGRYSSLSFLTVVESAAAADEANAALRGHDGYLPLVTRGGEHVVDGSTRTRLFLRIA